MSSSIRKSPKLPTCGNGRKFFSSPDPCAMSQEQPRSSSHETPRISGLDPRIDIISANNRDIGLPRAGGKDRVLSPEELHRREQLCARLRDRMMHKDDQLLTFFGLSKERKPTGRFITEKNTLARNVMRPNQGRIVPTSKKHGGHWFNVRPRPDFTSMQTFETRKTVDEIIDAVELVYDQWEGKGENELHRVYLPHHGAWECSTTQCGFKIRIFLVKPVGHEEAGVPVEFTVEVTKIWGCSDTVNAYFLELREEVLNGATTKQIEMRKKYEEEQKEIELKKAEGVEIKQNYFEFTIKYGLKLEKKIITFGDPRQTNGETAASVAVHSYAARGKIDQSDYLSDDDMPVPVPEAILTHEKEENPNHPRHAYHMI